MTCVCAKVHSTCQKHTGARTRPTADHQPVPLWSPAAVCAPSLKAPSVSTATVMQSCTAVAAAAVPAKAVAAAAATAAAPMAGPHPMLSRYPIHPISPSAASAAQATCQQQPCTCSSCVLDFLILYGRHHVLLPPPKIPTAAPTAAPSQLPSSCAPTAAPQQLLSCPAIALCVEACRHKAPSPKVVCSQGSCCI